MKKEVERCEKHGVPLFKDRGGNEYCLECAREMRKGIGRVNSVPAGEVKKAG